MTPEEFAKKLGGSVTQNPDDFAKSLGGSVSNDQTQEDLPWYKNLTQSLWQDSGIGRISASVSELGAESIAAGAQVLGYKDFANRLQSEIDRSMSEGVDMGSWLGKTKPLDTNNPLDAIAQGAKASSFFVPAGEVAGMGKVFGSKILGKMIPWFANMAPFAVPLAVGEGIEDLSKGKGVVNAGEDVAKSLLETYGTLGLFKGGGGLIKWASTPLLKSSIVREIAGRTTQLADKMYSVLQDARGATQRDLNTLQNEFSQIHRDASKAVGDSLVDKSAPTMTWEIMKRKVGDMLKKGYDAAADQFSDVYNPNIFLPKEMTPEISKEIKNALIKFDVPAEEAAKFFDSKGAGGAPVQGILGNLISDIKAVMFRNKGQIPFNEINALWRDYGVGSPKPAENQAIKNILMSLNKDARGFLSSKPEYKPLVDRWNQANELWSNLSTGLNGKFNNLMKVSANPKAFVDSIFTKNPKDLAENLRLLIDGLGKDMAGLDPETRKFLSQSIRNNVIDTAINYSRNPAQGGEKLKQFLDLWEPKGILHPEDVTALDHLADFMTGTYEDFANGIKEATGMADATAQLAGKGKQVVEKEAKADLVKSALKSIEGKPLYTKTDKGTYDFSNFGKVMEKLNTDGQFDDVIKNLEKYGDLSNVSGGKISGLVRTVVGASVAMAGHPVFGGGYALRGLGDIIGKTQGKIVQADVEKFLTEAVKRGDTSAFQKAIYELVSGGMDKAGGVMNRAASYSFDQFLKAAGILKGSDLDESDMEELKSHWESL